MASSTDFLVDHAYRNVWCSPAQDRQHIVAPARMSQPWGVIGNLKIGMRHYTLPTMNEWYHVFMIGDLPPVLVGMETLVDTWVSAAAHCNATSLLIDVYFNSGVHFPAHRTYFLYTRAGHLVVALKKTPLVGDAGRVQPFIRWRSNAWFDQDDISVPYNAGVFIEGAVYTDTNQFILFQQRWRTAQQQSIGRAWAYVNGRRVRDINTAVAKLGDVLEYVWDGSVKEVLEIKIKDLKSFDSIRDNKGKFLIPRPGLGTTIDYKDDIDVYLLRYTKPAEYTGVYYHQNQVDSVRMVTHRDYALPTAYVRGYVDSNFGWRWDDDLRVEVLVRHSGWTRELVDEHHRIKELFKLNETDRLDAMIGEDALVSVWTAAALENSPYLKLMEADYGGLEVGDVEEAYGYNAVSRLIGDTPVKIAVDQKWVTLPFGLITRSTVYEYNSDGRMIGWYIHDNSVEYPVRNAETRYIEAYVGKGGVGLYTEFDQPSTDLIEGVDYRFYLCDKLNGVPRDNWRDVTGDTTKYTIADGKITWLVDQTKYYTAVRNDLDFLSYSVDINYRDDLMTVTIRTTDVVKGLMAASGEMDIPPGELDVFLNGWGLIEDLDYYVEWPEICIVNKAHLVPGPVQTVTVRGRGFCNSSLERETPKDWGFVAYGMLSHNGHFHVRDDKVTRITIGGQLYTRDEVTFSEDRLLSPDIVNGTPYQISHPIIPMVGVIDQDTYALRSVSEAVDQEVEDYLTLKLPEPIQPTPNPIPAWYKVFSPLCAKLIYDMLLGILPMDEFKGEYSLQFLRERLRGYDWILAYDPALRGVDERYVIIHPHPENVVIELNVYQYRLLDRAIQVMLNGNVQINRHVVIVEEGYEHEMVDHPHPHRTFDEIVT